MNIENIRSNEDLIRNSIANAIQRDHLDGLIIEGLAQGRLTIHSGNVTEDPNTTIADCERRRQRARNHAESMNKLLEGAGLNPVYLPWKRTIEAR